MDKYALITESIKGRVTMRDAIDLYAPSPAPRHDRIPCPIHNGKDYNLHFTDKVYHCFVCNDGGDIINFIQHIFGLDFIDAIEKLNTDFNLQLPIAGKLTARQKHDMQMQAAKAVLKRRHEKAEQKAYDDKYNELWDEYARLDCNRMDYAPKNPNEEFNPLYIEAIMKIDYQKYLIDSLL